MARKYTTLPYTELPVATGNFDAHRVPIDRIVIHTMAGTWQGAAARFNNPTSKVSAHYGVKYDGGLIAWLEEYYVGYHAGEHSVNQRSIGIEHEDLGNYNSPRPDVLYATSAKLVADICTAYQFPCDRTHIIKHSEVIATGCPDSLDIDRIISQARLILFPASAPTDWQAKYNEEHAKAEALYQDKVALLGANTSIKDKLTEALALLRFS